MNTKFKSGITNVLRKLHNVSLLLCILLGYNGFAQTPMTSNEINKTLSECENIGLELYKLVCGYENGTIGEDQYYEMSDNIKPRFIEKMNKLGGAYDSLSTSQVKRYEELSARYGEFLYIEMGDESEESSDILTPDLESNAESSTGTIDRPRAVETAAYYPRILYFEEIKFDDGLYHYYEDEKGNEILHGKKSGGGKYTTHYGRTFTYDEEMYYDEGKLNGPFWAKGCIENASDDNGNKGFRDFQVNGSFVKDEPHGIWVIQESLTNIINGKKDIKHYDWCYVYDHGKIIGYKYSDDEYNKLYEYSMNKSGTWNVKIQDYWDGYYWQSVGLAVENGIKVGSYTSAGKFERQRTDVWGNDNEIDDGAAALIEKIKKTGVVNPSEFIEVGYTLNEMTSFCDGNKINDLGRVYEIIFHYSPINFIMEDNIKFNYHYYSLTKEKFTSIEKIKTYINELSSDTLIARYSKIQKDINYGYINGLGCIKSDIRQQALAYLEKKYKAADEKRSAEEKQWVLDKAKEINSQLDKFVTPWNSIKSISAGWPTKGFLVRYNYLGLHKMVESRKNASFDYEIYIKVGTRYHLYHATIEIKNNRIVDFERNILQAKDQLDISDTVFSWEKDLLSDYENKGVDDVLKTYKKSYMTDKINANDLDEYIQKLRKQKALINYCGTFANCRIKIAEKHNLLTNNVGVCESCKDILSLYNAYYETIDLSWDPTREKDNVIADMKVVMNNQKKYDTAMVMHKEIEATSTRIMENAEVCKNIVKSYSTYYKTADNAWKKSPTANELISAFSDIKAKQATFEGCIEQYKSVSANDKEILSKEKELKNIVKIYSSYLKECEKTWAVTAEPDAIKEGLGKTLSIQAAIQAAVTGGNASVLDKKVKESKCKDMEALLQVIK